MAKTTIYRHWPTREALLADAWASVGYREPTTAPAANLDERVAQIAQAVGTRISTPPMSVLLPDLLAAAERDPKMREMKDGLLRTRRRPLFDALHDAAATGDLPTDVDVELLVALIVGPIYYRRLIVQQPVTTEFVERVVAVALDTARHGLVSRPNEQEHSLRSAKVPYKWIVATIFVVGLFMDIMDTTIVNVALPTLRNEFHASEAAVEWVVIGYLLSLAVWIPASGWIGDRIGTKRTFLFALARSRSRRRCAARPIRSASSSASACSRAWAAACSRRSARRCCSGRSRPAERAKAGTMLIIPTVLAPAVGPIIGGWLVTDHSWRWIFYVNLPLGVFGFIIGALFLREHREPTAGRFDVAGFVLSGGGLALVLYALSEGPELGWRSPAVLGTGLSESFSSPPS